MDPDRADLSLVGGQEDTAAAARRTPAQPDDVLSWPQGRRVPALPGQRGRSGRGGVVTQDTTRHAVSVLADRLAAALVHHEPGWRLPRHSALARRYSVSAAEIDAAVDELIARHMVRRLADGQLYRASPAEYIIGLEGVPGLLSYVDAMGGEFTCRSRQVTWRLPPEDISWALRVSAAGPVCVVRFLWTAGGEPAALCTTYVPGDIAGRPDASAARPDAGQPLPATLNLMQLTGVTEALGSGPEFDRTAVTGAPSSLHVEMQAPPPSVARSLRLSAGQPAMMVTVRFDDQKLARPVALTTAVLRADMFRLVLHSPQPPVPDNSAGSLPDSWTDAAEDWEP
ncbi:MAG TPA: UTRA domain-containing protein [Streptosporangiaceae bacterium]|nr:UTRA domain-containing protein [Streptosporangiaceae bacterium]